MRPRKALLAARVPNGAMRRFNGQPRRLLGIATVLAGGTRVNASAPAAASSRPKTPVLLSAKDIHD
ncbi:MAG: hypothetical protein HY527_13650 [Betaproteobacteria bacterium]|nr:hypothetical protein [Betaproteobacteria bacterium]